MPKTALDLFAGMGGASLGLEWAGYHVDAIEFDETACRMHDHVCWGNIIQADIANYPVDGFAGMYDVLWASPPCQPFSQAGLRHGMLDPRAHLIFQVPRWVKAVRPRVVICEQVKAALPWWEAFAKELDELGYHTWTGLLHSEEYGVPQTRTRAFLFASLDGPVQPPAPTHRKYHTRAPHDRVDLVNTGLPRFRSMADVLNIEYDDLVGFGRRADSADSVNGYRRRDFREGADPAFTVTSKGRSWSLVGRQSKATARDSEQPAPTVTAGHDVSQWKLGSRLLTARDGLALQTFPPDCLAGLDVTKTAAFKAIGNAVPPLWAQQIIKGLESQPVTPDTQKGTDV